MVRIEVKKLNERELLDQEGLRTTEGVEGKEAKFMAALYGMNAGEQK